MTNATQHNGTQLGNDEPPIYLTGVSNAYTRAAADEHYGRLGLLIGPDTGGGAGSKADYLPHIPSYARWAADNGCFGHAGEFDEAAWLAMLDRAVNTIDGAWDSCLFAVAPDVYDPKAGRGDAAATIERSLPVLPKIRALGIPAALVLQDGAQDLDIPWDAFDVAFVGGSDEFKLGYPTVRGAAAKASVYDRQNEQTIAWARLLANCTLNDKPIHIGRVNSLTRLIHAANVDAESVDGTFIAFGGEKNLGRILGWYDQLAEGAEAAEEGLPLWQAAA